MKILFLTTHVNPGGITSYLGLLTKGLVQEGHQVFLASGGGLLAEHFENLGGRHIRLDIQTKSELHPKIYFALPPLIRLIRREDIGIIHSQTRITQVMGQMLRLLTHRPCVSTCHGFFKPRLSRRLAPCWGDKVIAISPAVQEHLGNDFQVSREKIVLIPHGLDSAQYPRIDESMRKEKKKDFGLEHHLVVGIIARLSDVKGHDILIRAMKQVLKEIPQARLVIVGEGRQSGELKGLVRSLGMENDVLFYPTVNKTAEILPLFDVFVMPSLQEGLGLSVMEAQACGLPVVATRVGGLISLIDDQRTGLLVAPKDIGGLAKAIMTLLQNPALARELGDRAKVFIGREYSAQKMIRQTIHLYQELISHAK
ncbi:MAG: glycosyltransferase family 4 protein [Candidatus Omnitrophota bacterium]